MAIGHDGDPPYAFLYRHDPSDRCEVKRCKGPVDVIYLAHGICQKHWDELMSDDAPPDALRKALGIEAAPMKEDVAMDGSEKSKKAEAVEAPGKAKGGKKSAKKAPREKKVREREQFDGEVVVFAFRLGVNDRDRIHAAAGPAGATKFVRSAALAAASGDAKGFEALVEQAKANTK